MKFLRKMYIIILMMKIFVWINKLIDLHIIINAKKMLVKIVKSNFLFIIKFNYFENWCIIWIIIMIVLINIVKNVNIIIVLIWQKTNENKLDIMK